MKEVDSFDSRQRIPSCQLVAQWTRQGKPSRLIHKVTVNGTKEPFNFSIDLGRDSTQQGRTEDVRSEPYIIMAYGSTPYVGMTPKNNGGHIQSAQMTRSKCPR